MTEGDAGVGAAAGDRVLRTFVESAPVVLLQLDTAGVVRLAAGSALQIPAEQMVGRDIRELAESPEQVDWVRRALAGERLRGVTRWGATCWQAQYAPLLHDGQVTGVAAVFTEASEPDAPPPPSGPEDVHLRVAVQSAAEALIVLDPSGTVTSTNARCTELFGAPVPPGAALRDLLDPRTAELVDRQLARRAAGESDRYELALRRADGTTIWLLVSASPMITAEGRFLGSVALLTDITRQKAVEERLRTAATVDPLTGVANRATLDDRLTHALARRDAGIVAVLFCDVDNLKTTNDTDGHAAGDDLLRQVASRITVSLRPADTIARYGGDEFVVVCEDLHSPLEAVQLAERIRLAVAQTDPGSRPSTVSIGVATATASTTPDQLLAAADAAAYSAKRAGRNRTHVDA